MAQHDPQAYGWLAASVLALTNALYFVIRKMVPKEDKSPLAEALRHDVEKLDRDVADLKKIVGEIAGDMKVIKFRLGLDGDQR